MRECCRKAVEDFARTASEEINRGRPEQAIAKALADAEGQGLTASLFPTLKGRWAHIDLDALAAQVRSITRCDHNPFLIPATMDALVRMAHRLMGADHSHGGYLEDRSNLWEGHYHEPGRTVHLGVDFNVPAGTPVHLPADGILVEHFLDADQHGGWGGKLTFQCRGTYLTLAHLRDIPDSVGRQFRRGDPVGKVAEPDSNGGWYEHLHVQCSREFDQQRDAYSRRYHGIERDFPNPFEAV